MKAIIFLNGEYNYSKDFFENIIDKDTEIYCADGGTNYCLEYNYIPNYVYGDLDSIKPDVLKKIEDLGVKIEKFPVDKDYSDFELVLEEIKEKNYKKIYVVGALGKRTDSTINNLFLLEKYKNITVLSETETIFYNDKSFVIEDMKNYRFSMISLDECISDITLIGFKYPLENRYIERGSSILMSNIILTNHAEVRFSRGKIIGILCEE
mgnify:FL=1